MKAKLHGTSLNFLSFLRFCRFFLFFGFIIRSLEAATVRRMVFPYDPNRRIDTDGRISPADKADEHNQGEVLCRVAAEEMEGAAGKENRRQGIDTAVDTLGNTVMSQFFIGIGPTVSPRVFTDAVKDDDGFVHRITDDRQDSRQEGGVDFQMEEGENT